MLVIANYMKNTETITLSGRRLFNKRIISSFVFIVFLLSTCLQSYACTIFNKQIGDKVLVGNNEDWTYSIPPYIWFVGAEEQSYGRVCFALSSYVQGGMNEKGLFYDGATCPISKVPFIKGNPELGMDFGEVVLSKCANVQEAVEMVKAINIPSNFSDHIMFTDPSGNSVVIEWVENELRIIPKEGDYQIATNFWLSDRTLGGYPCYRFDKVKGMLEYKNDLSVPYFTEVLKAASQNWGNGGTTYSNIYDLKNKEVYIYNKSDFKKSVKYNLEDELKKLKRGEKHIYKLEDIFYQEEKSTDKQVTAQTVEENKETTAASAKQQSSDKASDKKSNPLNIKIILIPLVVIVLLVLIVLKKRHRVHGKSNS